MKTYLSIAISIAASLAIPTMAAAHGGGGGGHFGGGAAFGGGAHFGGADFGSAHSGGANRGSAHFGGGHFGGTGHFGDGHRGAFWNGYWPYNEDWSYSDADDSTPYYSDSDSTVAAVQKALAREGYYYGPIDGALDLITQDAIARYDRDHHLPVTHAINQSLLNALRLG
jgi:hypothetical protein